MPEGWSDQDPKFWFLVTGLDPEKMTEAEVCRWRPIVQQFLADQTARRAARPEQARFQAQDVVCKTHNAVAVLDGFPTINQSVTRKAVYLVRDPRDVAVSWSAFYGESLDTAIDRMAHPKNKIENPPYAMFHHLGTWSSHVESWSGAHRIKFEDLVSAPLLTFRRFLKAFGIDANVARAQRAISHCTFDKLRAMEGTEGFKEANKGRFFRSGVVGQWRTALTADQVRRIEEAHGPVMRSLGYETVSDLPPPASLVA